MLYTCIRKKHIPQMTGVTRAKSPPNQRNRKVAHPELNRGLVAEAAPPRHHRVHCTPFATPICSMFLGRRNVGSDDLRQFVLSKLASRQRLSSFIDTFPSGGSCGLGSNDPLQTQRCRSVGPVQSARIQFYSIY